MPDRSPLRPRGDEDAPKPPPPGRPPSKSDLIDDFAAAYHAFNGITPARAWEQVKVLREFEAFSMRKIEDCGAHHLRAYLAKLVKDGLHVNTVRKRKGMIIPFYGWAFDEQHVRARTLLRMQRVKNPRGSTAHSTPKPYKRTEVKRFWKDLDERWPKDDRAIRRLTLGQRVRWWRVYRHAMNAQIEAIAMLALHAGMRRNEIFRADILDIHYDNAKIFVRYAARKNGMAVVRPREIPMTAELSRSLEAWFTLRAIIDPPHDKPWLSLTHTGPTGADRHRSPMSHDRFSELLSTVGEGYELHRLRHTCATEWLRAGLPLQLVQKLMGHARLQQTLCYAELLTSDLEIGMTASVEVFSTAVGRNAIA